MSFFASCSGVGAGGSSVFISPQDFEVTSSPDDTVSCLAFSPSALPGNFMIAGSWAHDVRCREAQQMHSGPVQDVCWSDDGTKVFTVTCNIAFIHLADHDAPIISVCWIKVPNYSCLMTGKQAYPMAVVTSADYGLIVYQLKNQLLEFRRIESTLKHQRLKSISIANMPNIVV
uniref:Uncharacterized protein n=1 Tax=Scleropages formosus TaxID=113540 RepID=A0A8C9S3S8_SCLFO